MEEQQIIWQRVDGKTEFKDCKVIIGLIAGVSIQQLEWMTKSPAQTAQVEVEAWQLECMEMIENQ